MEPNDPYAPPSTGNLKPLGSLAQSARGKELNTARRILIIVGVLYSAINGFLIYNVPNELEQALRLQQIDPAMADAAKFGAYIIYAGFMLVSLSFLLLGLLIKRHPVPITITGLVLYLLYNVAQIALNPESLKGAPILKILVIVALARAIKAAYAYNADTKKALLAGEYLE